MNKVFRAAKGLQLTLGNIRVFDCGLFDGKRVAVVGPASSAFNTGKGTYIDSFDYVIRMNKSPFTVAEGKYAVDIGTRTDVLFHCFHENPVGGGGPLDFALYEKLGIYYIINPRNEWSGVRNSFNFYKKYLEPQRTYMLPRSLYAAISRSVGPYRPTTGYSALYTLLESGVKELFITGFTFFKTAYGSGYRDEMKEAHQAQRFIKNVGLHNPDSELRGFKKVLEKNASKKVLLDSELLAILKQY